MDTEDRKLEAEKLRKDHERADAFVVMMKTQGWQLYVELLNFHIGERMKGFYLPTKPGEEYAEQHNKGTINGLLLARDLPSASVAAMKEMPTPAGGENE